MTKVVVTEKVLRDMVREAMWNKEFSGWSANHDEPATVNANVDPSAVVTDPINPNFTPQNKIEFGVAVNQLVKNLPDTQMPELFDTVKTAIDQKEDEEEMKTKASQGEMTQVEETVRKSIRRILADINPKWKALSEAKPVDWSKLPPVTGPLPPVKKIPAGEHGGEYSRRIEKNKADLKKGLGKAVDTYDNPPVLDDDEVDANLEPGAPGAAEPKRRSYKATALGGMSDVGGKSFEDIANDLGFSVAGAKQAVDKALDKARFLGDMDDEDLQILVLMAVNDYVKYLTKSGELSAADVQLMKDHPDIVRELDGFREFLHNYIRRARKEDQQLVNPLSDEEPVSSPLGPEEEPEAAAPSATAEPATAGQKAYKIYKGGAKYGDKPVVTRYKGKVYGPSGETRFSPNEQGMVSPSTDGKLTVKKADSDHTQTWDSVGEGKKAQPVLYLHPRSKRK